ncbi:MAG: hypothetical protein V4501_08820 [Pseudomonadota bacterium]
MFFITLIMGVLAGLIAITVISRYTKNQTIISALTVSIIVATMSLAKVYVVTYVHAATYEYYLKKDDPVCLLIATTYPDRFKSYIKNIKQIIRKNEGKDTQLFSKIELLNTIFNLTASKASNDSIYAYYQSELALYKALYLIDPDLVLFMEYTSKFKKKLNPGLAVLLSGELRVNDITEKKEAVILSAIKTPQPPLTTQEKEHATELLHNILVGLAHQFGEKTVVAMTTNPTDSPIDKASAALFIITFYQNILTLGKDDVGTIFRYFYNGQSASESLDDTTANNRT